jgi:hypothetical protein
MCLSWPMGRDGETLGFGYQEENREYGKQSIPKLT